MLGLCRDKKLAAMTNKNDGDNDGNKDGNHENNAASRSGFAGPIQSQRLGITEEDQEMTATVIGLRHNIYLCVALYIYPITTLLNM